jgi:hypothetical protein
VPSLSMAVASSIVFEPREHDSLRRDGCAIDSEADIGLLWIPAIADTNVSG